MLALMNQQPSHSGVAPRVWLQHHVPWLGLFVLVLSLFSEDADIPSERDELNG